MAQEIHETTSLDPFLLSYLAADRGSCENVDGRTKLGQAAQEAAVSNGLGVLPERVTGTEVSDDAQRAVIEAAAYSVTPITTHRDESIYVCEMSRANKAAAIN